MKTVPARLLVILCFLILPVVSYGQAEETTEAKIRNLQTQFSNHWNSNPEVAYLYIDSLKEIANRTGDLELKAKINSYEGIYYFAIGHYEKALQEYYEAIEKFEMLDLQRNIGQIYLNISAVYIQRSAFQNSQRYLEMAISLFQKQGDEQNLLSAYNNLGKIYENQDKWEQALKYYKKALAMALQINDTIHSPIIKVNLGHVLINSNDYTEAQEFLEEGISKLEKYKDYHSLGTAYMYLAKLQRAIGKTEKAEKQLKKSVGYSERAKDVNQRINSYKKLSELYESSGNLPGAIKYLKRYKNLEDSMALVNNDRKLNDAEFQFQLSEERLQKEKLVLEREKEAYIYKINRAMGIIMSLGLLVALVSLLYLFLTRKKLREANDNLEHIVAQRTRALKEINKELETFLYRSSHDMRGPLTTMKGLVNLAEITRRSELPEIFSRLDVTLSVLDRRIRKLKVVNEIISSGPLSQPVNLFQKANEMILNQKASLNGKKIEFRQQIDKNINVHTSPLLIEIMFGQLISNSVNFSKEEGAFVDITAETKEHEVTITVRDNGIGIDQEYIKRISEMYYKANERSKGDGLGLYLVRKSVEKLNGTLELKSILEVGTEVKVTIPS